MGDIGAIRRESFVKKLSLKSDGGGIVDGLYRITCSWPSVHDLPEAQHDQHATFFVDMDISLAKGDTAYDGTVEHEESRGLDGLMSTLQSSARLASGTTWSGRIFVVVPTSPGYLGRTNCFQQRFHGCRDLGVLLDRSVFGRHVTPAGDEGLLTLLDASLFIFVRAENDSCLSDETVLLEEVKARIDFPWLLNDAPKEKTLAIVDGHFNLTSYFPLYESATELGVKVVVLERPGHWLQGPAFQHLYEAFLPIDMTPDDGFPERIATALKSYGHVDGICAIATYAIAPVAKASALLGLPTEPADALARSNNKYETRLLDGSFPPQSTAIITDVDQLRTLLSEKKFIPHYPLITKPSHGAGSWHVYKARDEHELFDAVGRIRQSSDKKIVIERYIDGPELDVNLVLLNGELIFFEISDDFPCAGDNADTIDSDFMETTNVLPSRLPHNEYEIVRQKMHRLLLDLGLKNGVFHLEARVQNSSMEYREVEGGLIDLVPKQDIISSERKASCFLIEVNPRPPGFQVVKATTSVYGVNMYDLHVLYSIGEHERMRANAKAFEQSRTLPNHARAWGQLVYVKLTKGGICDSDDVCGEVLERLQPEERALVTDAMCCYGRGDRVPDPQPGILTFAAFFNLTSRSNRFDNLRVAEKLTRIFSIPVVPVP